MLLQHRADWVHHGGTWSIPGGALHRGESAWDAALREVLEETGLDLAHAREMARHVDDHGGWGYTTIVAVSDLDPDLTQIAGGEQQDLTWLAATDVAELRLHPGFGDSWSTVRRLVDA